MPTHRTRTQDKFMLFPPQKHMMSSSTVLSKSRLVDTMPVPATNKLRNKGLAKTSSTASPASAIPSSLGSAFDDTELIRLAEEAAETRRYFVAARYLREVMDTSVLTEQHERILDMADDGQDVLDNLLTDPHDAKDWKKQSETHNGLHDILIFYKAHGSSAITCRIESPIGPDLLVPLLSVLNESDLYETWMPSWKHPRVGIRESVMVKEFKPGNQLLRVTMEMPFPLCNRETIQHAFALDDIDEDNAIVIKVKTPETGMYWGLTIPEEEKGMVRIDMDAGILIRACPTDHAALNKTKAHHAGDSLILVSMVNRTDAHFGYCPMRMVNFFCRTVFGRMWASLLTVAEEVRDGKRPEHQAAIAKNSELYAWVSQRAGVMLDNLKNSQTHEL